MLVTVKKRNTAIKRFMDKVIWIDGNPITFQIVNMNIPEEIAETLGNQSQDHMTNGKNKTLYEKPNGENSIQQARSNTAYR